MGRWKSDENGVMTYDSYSLKFYKDEKELFSEAYDKEICGREVDMVFEKLKRHYKLEIGIRHNKRRNGVFRGWYIDVPYKTSFGLLCHEIAHAIDKKKRGKSKHDKKLMRVLGRVVNYCKKKNWWQEELNRRTEIKAKPVPTKDELQKQKLEKRKTDLARYKKKLNYYTNLYSNKIKKANRSISMLERYINSKPEVAIAGSNQKTKHEVSGNPPSLPYFYESNSN